MDHHRPMSAAAGLGLATTALCDRRCATSMLFFRPCMAVLTRYWPIVGDRGIFWSAAGGLYATIFGEVGGMTGLGVGMHSTAIGMTRSAGSMLELSR